MDVLTAGYPCQPFSHAGRRKGTNDVRHLWPFIADAIRHLRPRYVVLENVAGHLSLGLDRVLGDLAQLVFDAEGVVLSAADVGACHRRKRIFILATDTDRLGSERPGPLGAGRDEPTDGRDVPADAGGQQPERWGGTGPLAGALRLPRVEGRGGYPSGDTTGDRGATAPDPNGGRLEVSGQPDRWEAGPGLETPRRSDLDRRGEDAPDADDLGREGAIAKSWRDDGRGDRGSWGEYAEAIDRHARVLGRRPPRPRDDRDRLSPHFVEWMMMLPEGWVTDLILPNVDRTQALKILGNGVVPLQAETAVRHLLERSALEVAA